MKPGKDRITYDGVHLIAPLGSLYTVANVISRHTAWTDVLLGNRAPGVTLYNWLTNMDAIARIYVDAGDANQIQNGLSNSEKKEIVWEQNS